eukprot:1145878-Pelagomonas_calceolata.AAC.3
MVLALLCQLAPPSACMALPISTQVAGVPAKTMEQRWDDSVKAVPPNPPAPTATVSKLLPLPMGLTRAASLPTLFYPASKRFVLAS